MPESKQAQKLDASRRICEFSPDRRYRYTLWREWPVEEMLIGERSAETHAHEYLVVIGLNPSTADETKNDPTIRRCIDFAKRWGFGALCMLNLFAYRATKPEDMKKSYTPVGDDNDYWIRRCVNDPGCGRILAAWGKHGSHMGRAKFVLDYLPECRALRFNKDGSPEHPLYIPANTIPLFMK